MIILHYICLRNKYFLSAYFEKGGRLGPEHKLSEQGLCPQEFTAGREKDHKVK